MSPTNVFQQNEQRVNRLLLTYIAGEYAPLDSVSLNILKGIAAQCPLSGGEAVLRARALVRLLEPQVIANYNDLALCTIVDPRERKQEMQFDQVQIALYPNPVSSDHFSIVYHLPEGRNDYKLSLFNAYGTPVSKLLLDGNEGNKQVEIANLANGIYWFTVQTDEKRYAQGKFVVLH